MPVKIRGNDYMTVAERVTAAHTAGGFTMLDSFGVLEGEHPYWRTLIQVGDRQFIGTAQIKFNAPKGSADGDSPIECAETSALGRALGFAGFGVVEGIASADELARVTVERSQPEPEQEALQQQPEQERPTPIRPRTGRVRDYAAEIRDIAGPKKLNLSDAAREEVFRRHQGKHQLVNVQAELEARWKAEQTGADPTGDLASTTWKGGA